MESAAFILSPRYIVVCIIFLLAFWPDSGKFQALIDNKGTDDDRQKDTNGADNRP